MTDIIADGSNLDQASIYPPHFYLDIAGSTDGLIEEKLVIETSPENQKVEEQELQILNNSEPNPQIESQSLLSFDNVELLSNSSNTIQLAEASIFNVQATPITLVVNTTADQNDGSADNGLSLRDAIMIANSVQYTNNYKIVLTSGATYQLTAGNLTTTDSDQGGDLDIYAKGQVTITTDGNQPATINASSLATRDRVIEVGRRQEQNFSIITTGNLILDNTVITGGLDSDVFKGGGGIFIGSSSIGLLKSVVVSDNLSNGLGGGISNNGTILLLDSVVRNNRALDGGGIYNYGETLTILNSTIENNQSNRFGGGIGNESVATIINSTINNNTSGSGGGGIKSSGTLELTNVTVSSNTSTGGDGGGLLLQGRYSGSSGSIGGNSNVIYPPTYYYSIATISNSTIVNNRAISFISSNESVEGGIGVFAGQLTLRNTIVAGNTVDIGADIRSGDVINDDGSNLINKLNLDDTEIDNNIDPKLGPLQDNGGPTFTHALLSGSPALDAGNNANVGADVLDIDGDGDTTELIPFDQRGSGNPRIVGNSVDIGAFEYSIDPAEYGASNPDLIPIFGYNLEALRNHYYNNGINEGRSIDSFSPYRYVASYADLIPVFGLNTAAATQHYITNGYFEGRSTTSFEPYRYVASHADLITAFGLNTTAATQHYITNGYFEGRSTTSFDPARYLDSYDDLLNVFGTNTVEATQHYITNGYTEGRDPNLFPSDRYIASHSDLIQAFSYNLEAGSNHYLYSGRNEGRQVTFDPFSYMTLNGDVAAAYGNNPILATEHYIEYGYGEGRRVG